MTLNLSEIDILIHNYQYHYDMGNDNLLLTYEEQILEHFPSVNEFYIKWSYLLK